MAKKKLVALMIAKANSDQSIWMYFFSGVFGVVTMQLISWCLRSFCQKTTCTHGAGCFCKDR